MKFNDAVERYVRDMRLYGRINSKRTEDMYRLRLGQHSDDVVNRDPSKTGREDIKRTLARWDNPNTQAHAHAILSSFYDWTVEEGLRPANPARQVRRMRKRKPTVYRLTGSEVVALMDACGTFRERAVIHLGVLAGLRNQELRSLKGRHLARPGWIWVSKDIAKGQKERWVPVLPELEDVIAEAREHRRDDEYVICRVRFGDPGINSRQVEYPTRPVGGDGLCGIVAMLARRAGIAGHVTPHTLRHAFGDYVARQAGIKAAQVVLGHSSVATTEIYTGEMTLDELAASLAGITYRTYPPATVPVLLATGRDRLKFGIEAFDLPGGFSAHIETKVAVYAAHFGRQSA